MVGQLFYNIFGDVWVANGAHSCAFLVEFDYTRFEKTLWCSSIQSMIDEAP